ncbi:sterile alpha motif domain-containing protein 12-like [Petromyzon marinus]|uniref:Sterile alpha motif domain-containing protein 12-like n=2 Tax=Petromyzon marinus TaxID=7757 RepID=A0AAJ7T2D3_PETMA|nr:sterile alpha motif domain-containing protein 12-like [Petromyzon marinus]XP_032808924.1 sterile alpha motif domain-containing protein 12-like [Petromyzon marinus]
MQGVQLEPVFGSLVAAGQDEDEAAKWWDEQAGALGPDDVRLELGGDEEGAGSVEPSPSLPPPDPHGAKESNATQGAATQPGKRARSVAQWSVQDVCQWLTKVFPRTHKIYAERFKMHDVTGVVLLQLTERKLERIGLMEEQRQQLMYYVLRLRLKDDMRYLQQSLRRPFLQPVTPTPNSGS